MKSILKAFLISIVINFSSGELDNSEFVTLWTPNFAQEGAPYRVFIMPSNIQKPTEAVVEFRKSYATKTLSGEKLSLIEYDIVQDDFGSVTQLNAIMTLLRNNTQSGQSECSTKSVEIKPVRRNFYNFIQTDKPIYKPGDKVQFRILTVDKDLRPYHRNNIEVSIIDPFNLTITTFTDQRKQYKGIFTESFVLSSLSILGDYTIQVIVNKKQQYAVSKTFAVQEYTLPLFEVNIEIEEHHLLPDQELKMTIFARYSFGDYVKGDAKVIIKDAANGYAYSSDVVKNVQEPKLFKKNVNDLDLLDETKLKVLVEFTEPQSGMTFNKTAFFHVHANKKFKLTVRHPEKFLPDFPFSVEVHVVDWKGNKISDNSNQISLKYFYNYQNSSSGNFISNEYLKNGVLLSEYHVPNNVAKLTIEVEFPGSYSYYNELQMGTINIGINSLSVGYIPKNPKLNDQVKITVKSEEKLNDIIISVATRQGILKTKVISCRDVISCNFDVKIDAQMVPESTLIVYKVVNKQRIYQGKTTIVTENLGGNYLQLNLSSKQIKPRENLTMEFKTQPKSEVYVLGFDKRLTYLRKGNDFTKSDVIETVADYDGDNKIIVDDLKDWHVCKPEELKRVEKGRKYMTTHSDGTIHANRDEDYDDEDQDVFEDTLPTSSTKPASADELIRENFPETWIFDKLKMGNQDTLQKTFMAVDSITTWMLSAFSVNNEHGIALAPTQELVVKQDFFVKVNLPYSIRFTEILRVDVLIFNYRETLDVKVTLGNYKNRQIQLVEYENRGNICQPNYKNDYESSKVINVPANSVRSVYFYIRSHPDNNEFNSTQRKIVDIQVIARNEKDGIFIDGIVKKLPVDPVGIKEYKIHALSHNLKGGPSELNKQLIESTEGLTKINIVATGDMMGNMMNLNKKIETNPYGCLEQRTSKLKRNADIFRYMGQFSQKDKELLLKQHQMVRETFYGTNYNYKNHGWYRAHLVDALGSAKRSGGIDIAESEIEDHLEFLKKSQISNGTFANMNLHQNVFNINFDIYTERYFSTSFALLAFLKNKDVIHKDYTDVIDKAFKYLNLKENRLRAQNIALSIGAYAYALKGNKAQAEFLLKNFESSFIMLNNKKCFKIKNSDGACNILHTAYTAMALLKLNKLAIVEPVINFLMDINLAYGTWIQTFYNSILTEPIANMGIAKKSSTETNLYIVLSNQFGHKKTLEITENNSTTLHYISMPKTSTEITSVISGYGYCTLTIFEEIFTVTNKVEPKFKLDINTKTAFFNPNEKIIKVCAKYDSKGTGDPIIVNVIYEINMPSGYVYKGIDNLSQMTEIKQITESKKNTLAFVYFNDFKEHINYCVHVRALKVFDVKEIKAAGVKVYDYNFKENIALAFYSLKSNQCG